MSVRLMLSVLVLCCSTNWTRSEAQQISETYRKVNPSVVVVHVQEKTPSVDPQEGFVNLPTFGSGVLISREGKVLTAAHVVQSADKICVEIIDGHNVSIDKWTGQASARTSVVADTGMKTEFIRAYRLRE